MADKNIQISAEGKIGAQAVADGSTKTGQVMLVWTTGGTPTPQQIRKMARTLLKTLDEVPDGAF